MLPLPLNWCKMLVYQNLNQELKVSIKGFAQAWKVLKFRGLSWNVLENEICLEKYYEINQKP